MWLFGHMFCFLKEGVMGGSKRYYFPGGNTPKGFFSYYDHILSQEKAAKIYCMKGGPGTGKSTFMRKIGEEMLEEGYDVDLLLCSSDPDSLDGIVIKDKNVAMIDGTAPHIVDPKNPGAVDMIIDLGEFWNEKGLREKKEDILLTNDNIKRCFSEAYKYIRAAAEIYQSLEEIYSMASKKEEMYKNTAGLVYRELSHKELSTVKGREKRFFAGAITPKGIKNTAGSLIEGYRNVYILKTPVGMSGNIILEGFKENVLMRGFDTEVYYCPMSPDKKIEHVIVPELSTAIVTSNEYHEIPAVAASVIDMRLYVRYDLLEKHKPVIAKGLEKMRELLDMAVNCLKDAKASHDVLEEMYIPNMYFDKIEEKRLDIMEEIKGL